MDHAGRHPAALAGSTIWVDVEDLFDYARINPRPSGIQRLAFELYSALQARFGAGSGLKFVRHDPDTKSFRIVPWRSVAALFDDLVRQPRAETRESKLIAPRMAQFRRFLLLQALAFAALRDLLRAAVQPVRRGGTEGAADLPIVPGTASNPDAQTFEALVAQGDVLLMLGASWFDPGYGDLVSRMRRQHRLRTALLVYDLIPLRRPEWCSRRLVGQFSAWFERIAGECDVMFAISQATAADLRDYAAQHGIGLPSVVRAIPIGSGFGRSGVSATPDGTAKDHEAAGTVLPPAGSYVLMVATIEARKNHALMVRVWQQLLADLPRDAVPTLVFAGRVGWLAADLLQQIENDHRLDGKLMMIGEPSDGALRRLYQGCLFTVFPSLYEGWGLPVTESFTFGKPCVCAATTSLPEAGGTLARYFDPDNVADACRVIRDTVLDRAGLAAWEARVRAEFSPVSWQTTVDAILAGLAASLAPPAGPVHAAAQAVVDA